MPSRPNFPKMLTPRDVPKRKTGSESSRNVLLQPVAHIKLNAETSIETLSSDFDELQRRWVFIA